MLVFFRSVEGRKLKVFTLPLVSGRSKFRVFQGGDTPLNPQKSSDLVGK